MDIVQQHMLDSCRAAQHGEAQPPLPGTHDRDVLRIIRRRIRAWTSARLPPLP
ncbi:MAG TPA: hypothetical protein VN520_01530 [Streptomyces sp.]|uniref:hypothetical protein n=1 Tax=Streptomyces sp. TaxID=1931 RepID=UPI002C0101DD|nr:hypothetical protein [Streptomyces sp.]HWU05085.1 hypothetical protein [Streptomyces sp.]